MQIINNVDDNFAVYSGNDDLILPILAIGGVGAISVISNILPKQTKTITDSFFKGDLQLAKDTQLKYFKLMKMLFKDVNPIPIKECMNLLGLNVGPTKLPLSKSSDENIKYFKSTLKEYNLLD